MRILIVEDSPATRELLRDSLQRAGHTVRMASRCSSGLRLCMQEDFDAVVLDLMLPDGDGLDLCREIRAAKITTPILCLSAKGEVGDRIAGLDSGADDYLRKPFALAELHARLRALARRRGAASAARIDCGGVRIDFAARRLERDNLEVPLTAREWSVLELIAARNGDVLRREEILEVIWGEVTDRASESLDVILSRLRRKLQRGDGSSCIRTVRGLGYALSR